MQKCETAAVEPTVSDSDLNKENDFWIRKQNDRVISFYYMDNMIHFQ